MPEHFCTLNQPFLFLMQYNSQFGVLCLLSHVVLQYINLLCKCLFCNHNIYCNGTSVCALIALQLISNKLICDESLVFLGQCEKRVIEGV